MDYFDALTKLRNDNKDCDELDLAAALDSEINSILDGSKSARRYADAVNGAYERMTTWLTEGTGGRIKLNYRDMARHIVTYRKAAAYCILINKARQNEAQTKIIKRNKRDDAIAAITGPDLD